MAIALNEIKQKGPGGDSRVTVNFSSAGLNTAGGEIAITDPGDGFSIAIHQIDVQYHVDDTLTIREDTTTILGLITFKAAGNGFWSFKPPRPLILSANKELNLLSGGANAISGQVDYEIIAT